MNHAEAVTAGFEFDAGAVFRRVFVPVDFGESTRRALAVALELRRRFGSEVHLFRLTEPGENDEFLAGTGANPLTPQNLVDDAEERLRRFVDNVFPGKSGEVIVHAHVGADVVHGVPRSAKHVGATLVVLGAKSKQQMFRTHAEKIVQELDCPVLLVRA